MVFGPHSPASWPGLTDAQRGDGHLDRDFCFYVDEQGPHWFIRGHIGLPVVDVPGEEFQWSVWVSLSEESMDLLEQHWDNPKRVELEPRFGWLTTELPYDESTLSLPTLVHQRPPGQTPFIMLDPHSDHPLAREQREGITMHEVAAVNARLLGS